MLFGFRWNVIRNFQNIGEIFRWGEHFLQLYDYLHIQTNLMPKVAWLALKNCTNNHVKASIFCPWLALI